MINSDVDEDADPKDQRSIANRLSREERRHDDDKGKHEPPTAAARKHGMF